ncbi:MAG: M1 family metallopeptidase [Polyangiaceae bacterium]|nr:M1 family metallopeptidase [Polyangiaceae bacterium]
MRRTGLFLSLALVGCPSQSEGPDVPTNTTPSGAATVEAPAGSVPEATAVELPTDVVPRAYRLDLHVDPRTTRFRGHVEIDVQVVAPTSMVVLHARDLSIEKATIETGGRTLVPTTASRRAFGGREEPEELVLRLGEKLPVGPATLRFDYDAPFANLNGIYRAESDNRWFAFTQMEPTDARRAFPSFDEPRYKTPFELTLTVPKGMTAFANAKEASRKEQGEETRITFSPTEAIPTYLVALAVGDLETKAGGAASVPIRFVAPRGRAALGGTTLDATEKTLKALENYFQRPHPFPKLDIASVPNFGPGAMENAGFVTFREELVVLDDRSPATLRRRMQLIMAHELAHQWFGNLVTMRWWDDLWLNEGFATWMAPKTCDAAFPAFGSEAERVLDRTYAMNADILPSARAVRPKVELSDQIREAGGWSAYQKGASVLAMLESWIGEETFRKAILDYVNENAHKSITSPALFAALDRAANKPVSKVASSFLDQPSLPVVKVTVTCNADSKGSKAAPPAAATAKLEATDATGGGRTWTIPVCLRVGNSAKPTCTVIESGSATVVLPACDAVFPNFEEAGYFRYELDDASQKRLAAVFDKLDERERAGFLLNAWALVLLGRAEPASVVDLLKTASRKGETSRIVLEAVVNVLYDMDRFYVDDKNAQEFAAFVTSLLAPHRKRLGMPKAGVAEPDVLRIHRASVLGALFDLASDAAVAKDLEPIARVYLSDPAKADPDLGPLAVRVSARAGGAAQKELDEKRLVAAKTPDERVALVAAIASRRDPKDLAQALDLFANGTIRAGDWRHLRNAILRYRDGRDVFHAYLMGHFDQLNKQLGYAGALTSTIGATCNVEQVGKLTTYFEPKLSSLEGAQRGFDEGVAEAKRCIFLRNKGIPKFR